MKASSIVALLVVATVSGFCVLGGQAQADPIPGLFNTGVDDLGAPLSLGDVDPHYTLVLPSVADAFVIDGTAGSPPFPPAPPMWFPVSATSNWISHSVPPLDGGGITYSYSLSFDLTGLDPMTAIITGLWAVDDIAVPPTGGIFLNGVFTGDTAPGGPSALVSFLIDSGFLPAVNELEFVLLTVGAGFAGLRVEGLAGSAAPAAAAVVWPGGVGLVGLGLIGLVAIRAGVQADHGRYARRRWSPR